MVSFTNTFKKILGVILVIAGIILHLIPLFPAAWIIVLGLELLGLRILLQNKCKSFLSKFKRNKKDTPLI